jgi:hypothetical protein
VIDPQTLACLHEIIRRESLSVLIYVGQAYPWTTAKNNAALTDLKRIIDEEREAINAQGVFLARRRATVPWIGSFPSSFTTINFLALDHILGRLIEYEKQSIPWLEKELHGITDADARTKVQALLDLKRQHLRELELLAMPQPASV